MQVETEIRDRRSIGKVRPDPKQVFGTRKSAKMAGFLHIGYPAEAPVKPARLALYEEHTKWLK